MKLNKEICKKCHVEKMGWLWNFSDNIRWESNEVFCALPNGFGIPNSLNTNELNKDCPYYLEHLIMGEKK